MLMPPLFIDIAAERLRQRYAYYFRRQPMPTDTIIAEIRRYFDDISPFAYFFRFIFMILRRRYYRRRYCRLFFLLRDDIYLSYCRLRRFAL